MPIDAVSTWTRGNTLYVRLPHSHTVRLPADKPELLVRLLRERARTAATLLQRDATASARELPTLTLTQHAIDHWQAHNTTTRGRPMSAITGAPVRKTHWEAQDDVWKALFA